MMHKTGKKAVIVIIYLVLISILIMLIFDLRNKYEKEENIMISEVETLIDNAINTSNVNRMNEMLMNARDDYTFDIVVQKGEDVLVSTIPYAPNDSLDFRANEKVIAKTDEFYLGNNENRTFVWYSIYRLSDKVYIQSFLSSVIIMVTILIVLLGLSVILVSNHLFKPLRNIKSSIDHANKYDFESIESSDDIVNKQFETFVSRLENKISAVTRQHTELEKELQANRNHLNNTVTVSRSMIHDLKTPLHRNILENQRFKEQASSDEALELGQLNESLNHQVMLDINDILKLLKVDYEEDTIIRAPVNITNLVNHSLRYFEQEAEANKVRLNFSSQKEYNLMSSEPNLMLLINTLILTMIKYVKEDTEIYIKQIEKNKNYILKVSSKTSKENQKRLLETENLFDDQESNDERGLYLVKELTLILDGKYRAYATSDGVAVEVMFDYE